MTVFLIIAVAIPLAGVLLVLQLERFAGQDPRRNAKLELDALHQ
jgi:hypothetical protein